jgi:hypothetical protein
MPFHLISLLEFMKEVSIPTLADHYGFRGFQESDLFNTRRRGLGMGGRE